MAHVTGMLGDGVKGWAIFAGLLATALATIALMKAANRPSPASDDHYEGWEDSLGV